MHLGFLLTFLVRRLSQGVVIVLLVSFGIFAALRLIPDDPVRIVLGPMASDAVVQAMAQKMGLRDSIGVQYVRWLGQVARGNLGNSFIVTKSGSETGGARDMSMLGEKARVGDLLASTVPLTLQLAGLALAFTMFLSIPLGVAAGLAPGRWPDRLALYLGSVFVSVPNFWFAVMIALVVTARLHLIPSIGYEGFAYTILPAIVIAVELSPIFIRALSVSIADVSRQNFVALGAVRGLTRRRIFLHHIARNAAIPILNLFGIEVGALLGGVLIVEYIFNYPGFGLLAVHAILQRDFPVIQGVALLVSALFVVVNIVVDLISTTIDPRLEY